jgi:hypothetical protein
MPDRVTEGWLAGWMTELASDLQNGITAEHYRVTAKAGQGPLVYLTLEGGQGDVSTLRKIRPEIETITKTSIKKYVNNDDFAVSIMSASKGEDMMIAVEVIFPEA